MGNRPSGAGGGYILPPGNYHTAPVPVLFHRGRVWRAMEEMGPLPHLRRFRALTMGHTLLMGRRTHESIGRALPDRRNLVLSRDPAWLARVKREASDKLATIPAMCVPCPLGSCGEREPSTKSTHPAMRSRPLGSVLRPDMRLMPVSTTATPTPLPDELGFKGHIFVDAGTLGTGVTLSLGNLSYSGTMSGSNISGGTFGAVNGSNLPSISPA